MNYSDYIDPEHTGADRHLLEVFYRACHVEGGTVDEIYLRGLRAVLTDAARAQPVAQGPSEQEVSEWINSLPLWHGATRDELTGIVLRAFVNWGRSTPQPIPVSERLPSLVDCAPWPGEPDSDPWCWAGRDIDGGWEWTQLGISHFSSDLGRVMRGQGYTNWAPHWALPLPATPAAEEVQP